MNRKLMRAFSIALALMFLMGAAFGCTQAPPAAAPEPEGVKMKAGTYTGHGNGFSLIEPLPVHVTVSETEILDIKVDGENGETPPLLQTVIDYMIPRVLEKQSVGVDLITGATVSSAALRVAVTDALQQALDAAGSAEKASEVFWVDASYPAGPAETLDVDVVVVGMGGTGSAAAMRAAELLKENGGGTVLALEKAARYGGTSALTSHMAAINPPVLQQSINGGQDLVSLDLIEERLGPMNAGNPYWEKFKTHTGTLLDWLISHGFDFHSGPRRTGMGSEYPVVYDYGSTFGGNKALIASFFDKMVSDYEALGGKYMLETEGYDLIYDEAAGTVTGVLARNVVSGTEYIINAKAVILATGGFGGNPEMLRAFNSNGFAYKLIGSGQNTGEMIAAAWKLGAGRAGDEGGGNVHNAAPIAIIKDFPINYYENAETWTGRPLTFVAKNYWTEQAYYPTGTDSWTGRRATWSLNDVPLIMVTNMNTLFVGQNAKRYANESETWPWWQGGERYYSIFSEKQIQEIAQQGFDHTHTGLFFNFGNEAFPLNTPIPEMADIMLAGINAGCVVKADSVAGLAQQLKLDPATLEATVASYNAACEKGVDEEFGKPAKYLWAPGGEGPFYAVIGEAYNYSSSGGLTINENWEVTKQDGAVIGGLYAGGTDAMADTPGGFAGSAQTWAYMSGFWSAENAVKKVSGK
ncbi:MAG TPA: FAD-binding protein [Terriglobales bacterium]|nr:FAD-binding protein [Terriglobales bacterium]